MFNKKAAISNLKILTKRICHSELDSESIYFKNTKTKKRAAMFGLDARIALAIFGALSVITGAALFKAIGDAKVTALLTEMQEVGKAYDAYYLDTGEELPVVASDVYLNMDELVESTKTGWKGPYLPYSKGSVQKHLDHPTYGYFQIAEMLDGKWTSNNAPSVWADTTRCDTGTVGGQCSIYIVITNIPDGLFESLDTKVDNSEDSQTGNVRNVKYEGLSNFAFLKYRPKQK